MAFSLFLLLVQCFAKKRSPAQRERTQKHTKCKCRIIYIMLNYILYCIFNKVQDVVPGSDRALPP